MENYTSQDNALRIADVINRGKDGEELKYVYSIDEKIFPQAENNCLPISIMLASVIERGVILGEKQFSRGKTMHLINSKNLKKKNKSLQCPQNRIWKIEENLSPT